MRCARPPAPVLELTPTRTHIASAMGQKQLRYNDSLQAVTISSGRQLHGNASTGWMPHLRVVLLYTAAYCNVGFSSMYSKVQECLPSTFSNLSAARSPATTKHSICNDTIPHTAVCTPLRELTPLRLHTALHGASALGSRRPQLALDSDPISLRHCRCAPHLEGAGHVVEIENALCLSTSPALCLAPQRRSTAQTSRLHLRCCLSMFFMSKLGQKEQIPLIGNAPSTTYNFLEKNKHTLVCFAIVSNRECKINIPVERCTIRHINVLCIPSSINA